MRNHLSTLDSQTRPRAFRQSVHSGLLVFAAMLQCAPLLADAADSAPQRSATSARQEEISSLSGGVGDDARAEMRQAAAAYNVHVVFSERQGSYLANIPFTVALGDGREIYSGVSEGPLLYLKLPPGAYQISAEIDGVWQKKRIRAGAPGSSATLSFVAKGE